MHFQQYGKTFQLRLESADDLAAALNLDESHWVATSAPTDVFRCDPGFIAMLDPDGSGRIHTDEMKAAIRWLLATLSDRTQLQKRTNHVPLAAIDQSTPEGAGVYKSAVYVLKMLGNADGDSISLKQVRRFLSKLKEQPLNGDGVLVVSAASDPKTAGLIQDVIATVGGATDASGVEGITGDGLARFRQEVDACVAWRARGAAAGQPGDITVRPFGDQTEGMYALIRKHADRIDHFFALCRAVRFDTRMAARIGGPDSALDSLDLSNPDDVTSGLQRSPLATPNRDERLPLGEEALNPLYAEWVIQLQADVLAPVLGEVGDSLHVDQWQQVKQALQPYADYVATQKGTLVRGLSDEQLRQYQLGDTYGDVERLIAADKDVADMLKGIREVEKLVLYHQHLLRLANNFISFSELYQPPIRALFEEGSALIDGRWFDLALRVNDVGKHSDIAKASNIFTLYIEVTHKASDSHFTVAVPATAGCRGNLGVGKRGVFFDWLGREYDAVVVKIIDNPISLREALVAPFTRLWGFVMGKIEAMSGNLEKQLQKSTGTLLEAPQQAAATSAPTTGIAGGPAGMLVGLSLSAAAIGSAFAFITKTLSGLSGGQIIAGVLGAAVLVALPVSLIAILKLRRQDLSALLEGCGWAINARMRFDNIQRRSFTRRKPYPAEATGTPTHTWVKQAVIAALVIVLAWGLKAGCRGCARGEEDVETSTSAVAATNAIPAEAAQPAP